MTASTAGNIEPVQVFAVGNMDVSRGAVWRRMETEQGAEQAG